jgi:hypothetical protein
MLKILGEYYYLDLDEIDNYLQIKDREPSPEPNDGIHISIVKYETIKLMLEVIMDEHGQIDEALAGRGSETTIPFKLAFNTLLNKKLINKY